MRPLGPFFFVLSFRKSWPSNRLVGCPLRLRNPGCATVMDVLKIGFPQFSRIFFFTQTFLFLSGCSYSWFWNLHIFTKETRYGK